MALYSTPGTTKAEPAKARASESAEPPPLLPGRVDCSMRMRPGHTCVDAQRDGRFLAIGVGGARQCGAGITHAAVLEGFEVGRHAAVGRGQAEARIAKQPVLLLQALFLGGKADPEALCLGSSG